MPETSGRRAGEGRRGQDGKRGAEEREKKPTARCVYIDRKEKTPGRLLVHLGR